MKRRIFAAGDWLVTMGVLPFKVNHKPLGCSPSLRATALSVHQVSVATTLASGQAGTAKENSTRGKHSIG